MVVSEEEETYKYTLKFENKLRDFSAINLVIAKIIAKTTFAAALTKPGGYNEKGLPVLRGRKQFEQFLQFDILAFIFSIASLLIHYFIPVFGKFVVIILPVFSTTYVTTILLFMMVLAFERCIGPVVLAGAGKQNHYSFGRYHLPSNIFSILLYGFFLIIMFYFLLPFPIYIFFKRNKPCNNVRTRFGLWS